MTPRETGDEMCRCGHRNGDHAVTGECEISRRWAYRGQPCGCVPFVPVTR